MHPWLTAAGVDLGGGGLGDYPRSAPEQMLRRK